MSWGRAGKEVAAATAFGQRNDPSDPLVTQRHGVFSQLVVATAIGFLLFLTLPFSSGRRQPTAGGSVSVRCVVGAEQRLAQLHQLTAYAAFA